MNHKTGHMEDYLRDLRDFMIDEAKKPIRVAFKFEIQKISIIRFDALTKTL